MDRSDKSALGVAILGHVLLFALLSVSLLWRRPPPTSNAPMDVTLSTEVALESAAPQIAQQPAESQAPDIGPPAEAAQSTPAPPAKVAPQPAPPLPKPAPQPKPAEVSKPRPEKQQPAAKPKPQPAPQQAKGDSQASAKPRERGSHLGPNFLKGITAEQSDSHAQAPRAAKIGAQDIANINGLIQRQVLPCYDLGALKGTSAMSIVTVINLRFRPDGSVASASLVGQTGVNAGNQQYRQQIVDLSRRAVLRCSPLKGLPPELYKGGWENINFTFTPSDFG